MSHRSSANFGAAGISSLSGFKLFSNGGIVAECPEGEEDSILTFSNGQIVVLRNTEDRDTQCEVLVNLAL
jgi:hypothetical protein